MPFVQGFLVAFVLVAGFAIVRWRLHGRDPRYLDDDSILLAAPPEGMTAAVATVIDGGPTSTAFMAALLDLASRDEIAFRDETPRARTPHRIGIEVHGGPNDDPRVALNRRRPIGEGEAWLRGAIRTWAAGGRKGFDVDDRRAMMIEAVASTFGAAASGGPGGGFTGAQPDRALAAAGGTGDVPANPFAGGLAGFQAVVMEQALGKDDPALVPLMHEAMADPDAVLADPAAFAARVAAVSDKHPTADEMRDMATFFKASRHATDDAAQPPADGHADTISARDALRFGAPLGFGTLLESYARRRGWIEGLSMLSRWKWRAIAGGQMLAGLLVIVVARPSQELVVGLGLGVLLGGGVTWVVAPHMATRTRQGAVMRAQVAAYRRTLKATFDSSATLDDAVATSRLRWIETPDQALVWGVALGLRPEIEALLARTQQGLAAGSVDRGAFLPGWVRRTADTVRAAIGAPDDEAEAADGPADGVADANPGDGAGGRPATRPEDYALVFAGIERIGSEATDPATSLFNAMETANRS